ncbi:hypothetical protein RHIZ404_210378 [Rhizobium sp. EC-SD404]|nr:hypothetical protein RHIZ404_210378 [Rhizobium sp. EC-SD404]
MRDSPFPKDDGVTRGRGSHLKHTRDNAT